MLRGFYQYFGLHHCQRKLDLIRHEVQLQWVRVLRRRSQRHRMYWSYLNSRSLGTKLEQDLFKQRSRLADAERILQIKPTKAATENQRIATDKILWTLGKLDDLRRTELKDRDSRIFPGYYAPVMIVENGQRVVKPMRY